MNDTENPYIKKDFSNGEVIPYPGLGQLVGNYN
jgi:hypothetical protein